MLQNVSSEERGEQTKYIGEFISEKCSQDKYQKHNFISENCKAECAKI